MQLWLQSSTNHIANETSCAIPTYVESANALSDTVTTHPCDVVCVYTMVLCSTIVDATGDMWL